MTCVSPLEMWVAELFTANKAPFVVCVMLICLCVCLFGKDSAIDVSVHLEWIGNEHLINGT